MEKNVNDVLHRNVKILSKHSEREDSMMPEGSAPMPSVECVKKMVSLVKSIIFSDYFYKRQTEEEIRSYYIGVNMEELYKLLCEQIARGLFIPVTAALYAIRHFAETGQPDPAVQWVSPEELPEDCNYII